MSEEPSELEALKAELTDRLNEIYDDRGVPSEWQDVTPDVMRPAFTVHFKAFPSPSSGRTGADEAEHLIHNPLKALRDAGVYEGDGELPDISTFVVNHQHTLNRMVMYASVVVSQNPHTIGITLVKEPMPADLQELADQIDELEAEQSS